jgi:hypothetical protein
MNLDQLKKLRERGAELLGSEVAPPSINVGERTVDCIWYTGADVPRVDYFTGEQYTLKFAPAGADLSLLNSGAPILDGHDSSEGCKGQMGRVERAWVQLPNYKATLRFSPTSDADSLWGKIAAGIVTKFSMGVYLPELTEQRDGNGKLLSKTALKWQPYEISCVPIPADFGTTTLAAAANTRYGTWRLAAAHRAREAEILRLR